MKRSALVIPAIVTIVIMFCSCKKVYECSCISSTGGHEHFDIKAKKSDAESACKALAVGTYTSCELE